MLTALLTAATLTVASAPAHSATGNLAGAEHTAAHYTAVEQTRVLDTRDAATRGNAVTGLDANNQVSPQGGAVTVRLADVVAKVPDGDRGSINAVVVNVTVVDAGGDGYLTAWGGGPKPWASTINFVAGETQANGATLPFDLHRGHLKLFSSAPADVLVDVMGFYHSSQGEALGYVPVHPVRLLDSRESTSVTGGAMVAAGETVTMPMQSLYQRQRGKQKAKHARHKQRWQKKRQGATDGAETDEAAVLVYDWPTLEEQDVAADLRLYGPNAFQVTDSDPAPPGQSPDEDNDGTDELEDDLLDEEITDELIASEEEVDELCRKGDNLKESDVEAVVLNITAVSPTADGFLKVWPAQESMPGTSSVNYQAGEVVANNVVVATDDTASLALYSMADTHVVVDIVGFIAGSGGSSPDSGTTDGVRVHNPVRVFDSRESAEEAGFVHRRTVPVAGVQGLPQNLELVYVSIVVVRPEQAGFATVGATVPAQPTTSHVNFDAGDVAANTVPVKVGEDGTIMVHTHGGAEIVVDITGHITKST